MVNLGFEDKLGFEVSAICAENSAAASVVTGSHEGSAD
jgi:hypothetical protein